VLKLHCLAVSRDGGEGALHLILDYHEHDLAGAHLAPGSRGNPGATALGLPRTR
jgi:hypothetical protein